VGDRRGEIVPRYAMSGWARLRRLMFVSLVDGEACGAPLASVVPEDYDSAPGGRVGAWEAMPAGEPPPTIACVPGLPRRVASPTCP
jgi:hypothetical protein